MVDFARGTDWGHYRVPMHPDEGTELYGRNNFFIHGGIIPGSAGCQDLGKHDREFFHNFKKAKGKVKVKIE